MKQNHGKGLFGFLAGVSAGGIVALLTAKRKGADVRKDLLGEWDSGKSGVETLKNELKGVASGAKDGFEELTSSDTYKKLSKDAQKKWTETKEKADSMVQEAQERASSSMHDAKDKASDLIADAQDRAKKMMEDAKNAIMPEDEETPRKKAVSALKKSIPKKK